MSEVVKELVPLFGVLVPITAIVGGIGIAAFSMYLTARSRQMAHRERLAMIERGLVPPSEPVHDVPTAGRWVRSGIIVMSLGLGMAVMIAFASNGLAIRQAIGVGGMLFLLGVGLSVVGYVESRRAVSLTADTQDVDSSARHPPVRGQ